MPETPNSFEELWNAISNAELCAMMPYDTAKTFFEAGQRASLPTQAAAVPARQPYWNCPNNPEHALESYPRLLSQNMRCKVCGIAPQFTVPARQDAVHEKDKECPSCDGKGTEADYVGNEMRCVEVECSTCKGTGKSASSHPPQTSARQDAVPEKEKCDICGATLEFPTDDDPMFEGDTMVTSKCRHVIHSRASTQPTQAAVGGGETVPADVFNACMVRMGTLETERDEAIAQRDEAREEISDLQSLLRTNGAALATSIYQKLDLEDRLAALDVPKPESEELADLDSAVRFLAAHVGWGEPHVVNAHRVLSRLRSLPSEPGSGVQRKAVENGD